MDERASGCSNCAGYGIKMDSSRNRAQVWVEYIIVGTYVRFIRIGKYLQVPLSQAFLIVHPLTRGFNSILHIEHRWLDSHPCGDLI